MSLFPLISCPFHQHDGLSYLETHFSGCCPWPQHHEIAARAAIAAHTCLTWTLRSPRGPKNHGYEKTGKNQACVDTGSQCWVFLITFLLVLNLHLFVGWFACLLCRKGEWCRQCRDRGQKKVYRPPPCGSWDLIQSWSEVPILLSCLAGPLPYVLRPGLSLELETSVSLSWLASEPPFVPLRARLAGRPAFSDVLTVKTFKLFTRRAISSGSHLQLRSVHFDEKKNTFLLHSNLGLIFAPLLEPSPNLCLMFGLPSTAWLHLDGGQIGFLHTSPLHPHLPPDVWALSSRARLHLDWGSYSRLRMHSYPVFS